MKRLIIWIAAAIAFTACETSKQDAERFDSTIVNADGTVTFRYVNPHAKEVLVDVQFAGRNAMTLDTLTGMWSATVGPAAPDMYPYCFVVDGVSIMDPANPEYFPNEGFKNSLLDIPGNDGPLPHAITDVPHGNVDYVKYYSNAIGGYNNAIVYTPPTYATDTTARYPVFYLISGTTDTEEVYYKVGRMNYILDNLIAQGKAKDMIIVLPYGNPAKLIPGPTANGIGAVKDYFSADLIGDLMPYVEQHYRTINDADHRAIGGFSRGGNQALMNGLMHLDLFSYLCSYSSFTSTGLPKVYDDAEDTNSKIHLLWSGVGTDDFLYGTARDYTEFLDDKGITCVKLYTDDKYGHTWMNAKYFLAETLPLLFDEEAAAQAMAQAQPTKARTGEEQQFTPGVMARLFPKPIISPDINDGNVTFRIKAPEAAEVLLAGDMLNTPVKMEQDTLGIWSVTLTDLAPDVYCYHFVVDSTEVCDSQNMYLTPGQGFKQSTLDLTPTPYIEYSYTPVQYRAENTPDGIHRYAVVSRQGAASESRAKVSLIAKGDNAFEGWHKIVKANMILDQLVAEGKCPAIDLYLADRPIEDAVATIDRADYPTWSEARKALITTLQNIK